jgi:predicted DNA-binding protein (UPF0251 family)
MYDKIRAILAWEGKPMRVPNVSEWSPNTWYIRAVWQRVGGVWRTNKQAEVAANLGISLATLKRYMTTEGACPYAIQFALESMAGMGKAGQVYTLASSVPFCTELMPFSATRSSSNAVNIALTQTELEALQRLAAAEGFEFSVSPSEGRI